MASRIRRVSAIVVLGVVALLLILLASSSDRQAVPDGRAPVDREVVAALPGDTGALIERLWRTNLLNAGEIHDRLGMDGASAARGFLTSNPYEPPYSESCPALADLRYPLPPHLQSYDWGEAAGTFSFRGQEPVLEWYSSMASDTEVCAVRFADSVRLDYRFRTFPDAESAVAEGHVITHRRHCGTCSSLRDLAA